MVKQQIKDMRVKQRKQINNNKVFYLILHYRRLQCNCLHMPIRNRCLNLVSRKDTRIKKYELDNPDNTQLQQDLKYFVENMT